MPIQRHVGGSVDRKTDTDIGTYFNFLSSSFSTLIMNDGKLFSQTFAIVYFPTLREKNTNPLNKKRLQKIADNLGFLFDQQL